VKGVKRDGKEGEKIEKVEFKPSLSQMAKIMVSISAFSNTNAIHADLWLITFIYYKNILKPKR
jgi:predicted HTH transcriptional regulator